MLIDHGHQLPYHSIWNTQWARLSLADCSRYKKKNTLYNMMTGNTDSV